MAIAGAVVGWLLAGMFGRPGPLGWLLAALGGLLVALISGALGSAIGLLPDLLRDGWQTGADLIRIGGGALVAPFALAGQPLVALGWAVLVGITHVLAGRRRRP